MAKGQFKKGNKSAVGRKSKAFVKSIYNKVDTTAINEKKVTDVNNNDYLPFGDNNLFPQEQAALNRKSPVFRSIINSKRDYIVGKGYKTENDFFLNYKPNKMHTMFDLTAMLGLDRLLIGNEWIEVISLNGTFLFHHLDSTKVRFSRDRNNAIVHPYWSKYNSQKKYATVYPFYPNFEKVGELNGERCIVHIADYEPTFSSYGLPSNIAGNDSASINYKTNRWNLSRIENSFQTSGLLQMFADFEDEDAKNFSKDFDDAFLGEANAGKPLKVISPPTGERNDTKWIPFNDQIEGHWTSLHDQAIKELCTANQWFPSLSGINVPSGFDVARIRNEYNIALSGVISREQQKYLNLWKMLFSDLFGQDLSDLEFKNKNPFQDTDLINFDETLSKNEKRNMLGFESVEEEETELSPADTKTKLQGVEIITSMLISDEAKISLLMSNYGYEEAEATLIII